MGDRVIPSPAVRVLLAEVQPPLFVFGSDVADLALPILALHNNGLRFVVGISFKG